MEGHGRERCGHPVVEIEGNAPTFGLLRGDRLLDEPVPLTAMPVDRQPQLFGMKAEPEHIGLGQSRLDIHWPERRTGVAVGREDTDHTAFETPERQAHPCDRLAWLQSHQLSR